LLIPKVVFAFYFVFSVFLCAVCFWLAFLGFFSRLFSITTHGLRINKVFVSAGGI